MNQCADRVCSWWIGGPLGKAQGAFLFGSDIAQGKVHIAIHMGNWLMVFLTSRQGCEGEGEGLP